MVDAGRRLTHSWRGSLAAALSGHEPVEATSAATRELTRKPRPSRALALNIRLDAARPSSTTWREKVRLSRSRHRPQGGGEPKHRPAPFLDQANAAHWAGGSPELQRLYQSRRSRAANAG